MFLILPYPPSVNHYYVRTKWGGLCISAKGQSYRKETAVLCRGLKSSSIDKPIHMEVSIIPPDKRKRDIDNICKALLDSLQYAAVFNDDNQIQKLTLIKYPHLINKKIVVSPTHGVINCTQGKIFVRIFLATES